MKLSFANNKICLENEQAYFDFSNNTDKMCYLLAYPKIMKLWLHTKNAKRRTKSNLSKTQG